MLTNNFRSVLECSIFGLMDTKVMIEDGTESSGSGTNYLSFKCSRLIKIGTGTTEAKQNDYKLESEIDSGKYTYNISLSGVTGDGSYDSISGFSVVATVTNVSEEELTINEVGLFGNSTTNISANKLMFLREVYDTPIIMEPGETKSFVLNLM